MWPAVILGLRLLAHNKVRLLLISVSVAVGVVIMLVELGLLLGVLDSQANIATRIRGDLVVMNRARVDLHRWDNMYPVRLNQIEGVAGVARVAPIYEDHVGLKNPQDLRVRRVILYAVQPDNIPLDMGDATMLSARLKISHGFLFDRLSRPIYGRFLPGDEIEIDRFPLLMAGYAEIGPDIVNDGAIVISEGDWLERSPDARPIMGVITLKRGANLEQVRRNIFAHVPKDIVVLTPKELRQRENASTLRFAPVGLLFAIGMLAGLAIGTINCYQVLYTEVSDHLPQYATLKATGFSDEFLRAVIMAQAVLLSLTGFAAGLFVAFIADAYIAIATILPVRITGFSVVFIGLCTIAMCIFSGLIAVQRAAVADPATLY